MADSGIDFNEAFMNAIMQQFFSPVVVGMDPNGGLMRAESGVAVLARTLYQQNAERIKEAVWAQIDMDDFAKKIADLVVADLLKVPGRYDYGALNNHRKELLERVMNVVALDLGQRIADQMNIQLSGPPALEEGKTE